MKEERGVKPFPFFPLWTLELTYLFPKEGIRKSSFGSLGHIGEEKSSNNM
jgi:hypothetical protein